MKRHAIQGKATQGKGRTQKQESKVNGMRGQIRTRKGREWGRNAMARQGSERGIEKGEGRGNSMEGTWKGRGREGEGNGQGWGTGGEGEWQGREGRWRELKLKGRERKGNAGKGVGGKGMGMGGKGRATKGREITGQLYAKT